MVLQVPLGAVIVKNDLLAWLVAVHMGTALVITDLLVLISVLLSQPATRPVSSWAAPAL